MQSKHILLGTRELHQSCNEPLLAPPDAEAVVFGRRNALLGLGYDPLTIRVHFRIVTTSAPSLRNRIKAASTCHAFLSIASLFSTTTLTPLRQLPG